MWIVAATADWHVNSRQGLCPSEFHHNDGQVTTPSAAQEWLNARFTMFWARVAAYKAKFSAARVLGVVNGDALDKNRHSSYQIMSVNEADIIQATVEVAAPMTAICDEMAIVRGTEAHTGGDGWMEETFAGRVATVKPAETVASWYWFDVNLDDFRMAFAHHPGTNSRVPWTIGNAANRAAVMLEDEFFGEPDAPRLVTYAHVHHSEDSGDNHKIRVMFLPPWKLGDAYDARGGMAGRRFCVGGNIYIVARGRDGARLWVDTVRFYSDRQVVWTPKQL